MFQTRNEFERFLEVQAGTVSFSFGSKISMEVRNSFTSPRFTKDIVVDLLRGDIVCVCIESVNRTNIDCCCWAEGCLVLGHNATVDGHQPPFDFLSLNEVLRAAITLSPVDSFDSFIHSRV